MLTKYCVLSGLRVLDAGCGAGEYVAAISSMGASAQGVEYFAHKVQEWDARYPGDDRVQQGDLTALPFPDDSFDVVLLNEVLEHVNDERKALKELHRVLRSGGLLFVFSPNRRYPFESHGIDTLNGRRIPPIRTFGLPWLPIRLVTRYRRPWARNYWPGELGRIICGQGFALVARDYVWQTFENISGTQNAVIRKLAPFLRGVARLTSNVPFVRTFGSSQVVVARQIPTA